MRPTVLLAGVTALLLGGCGIGSQDTAQRLPVSQVPFGLLSPSSSSTPKHGTPPAVAVILYLLRDGHLVAVARELPAPAPVDSRLSALAAGPTASEAAEGLASAVSAQSAAPTGVLQGGEAVINLTSNFEQLATRDQVEALAQLVYTATAIPGIDTVSFRIDKKVVAVPRGNNTSSNQPVTRGDYSSLAPLFSP